MTVTLPAWLAQIPDEQPNPPAFVTVSGAHLHDLVVRTRLATRVSPI